MHPTDELVHKQLCLKFMINYKGAIDYQNYIAFNEQQLWPSTMFLPGLKNTTARHKSEVTVIPFAYG